ncbi:MAG TPA: sulfite exporter TauE/SafE family protein [Polyangiaceae bacterium]|nr:sulfite exporter TauE/SafE family protein [Polyangiaceae bacterium]
MLLPLLGSLVLLGSAFAVVWGRLLRARTATASEPLLPTPFLVLVGFVTDFLDTLGIGSFATTTSAFRLSRRVDDRLIPGTMNVGHALPTIVQALIYVTIVKVEMTTLLLLIGAAVAGAWLGSGFVVRWPRRAIQVFVGTALLVAATIMGATALGALPKGGDAVFLRGPALAVAASGNFALGALMSAGIGLYGPCMILVSVLGMSPKAAFPIMMGSCAFLMPVSSIRFVRSGAYDPRAALGLAVGGIPAVLIAAFVVKSLTLDAVRWLVIAIALYTAATLLLSGRTPETKVPRQK